MSNHTNVTRCRHLVLALCLGLGAAQASAQVSRAEEMARLQAEKAKTLHPYEETSLERWAIRLQEKFLAPQGFYPAYGGLYSGGGFQLGAAYRHALRDADAFEVKGVYSLGDYKLAEVSYTAREVGSRHLDLRFDFGFRDAPSLPFFGVGNGSIPENETNALVQELYSGATLRLGKGRGLYLGGRFGLLDHTSASGHGDTPEIDDVFGEGDVPGLGADPDYLLGALEVGFDTRPSPLYSREGGRYRATYAWNHDLEDSPFDFRRLDLEASHKFPILRGLWVLALRAEASGVYAADDQVVPWYKLPSLGGGSSLRGYSSYRFRDSHSLLLGAEWWWMANRALDMAVFFDAGKVAGDWSDLDLDGMNTDWGIGVRLHTPRSPILRVDLAHGDEGWHVVWAVSQAF